MTEGLYSINSLQFLLLLLRLQQVPTVGVFLFLTQRLECSVGRLSSTVNGTFGTLFDLNSPTQYLRGLDGPSGRCVAAPCKAAVYRITKFMILLYHRLIDEPKWMCRYLITLKYIIKGRK